MSELDIRDFDFLVQEAEKRRLERKAEQMEDMRFSMWAEGEDFGRFLREVKMALMPEKLKEQTVKDNWEALKKQGRG